MKRHFIAYLVAGASVAAACAATNIEPLKKGTGGSGGGSAGAAGSGGESGSTGGSGAAGAGGSLTFDAGLDTMGDGAFNPDAACAQATETATVEKLPVDIIWMVDNSVSMQPAVDEVTAGLNAFAMTVAGKALDYKVIMLSLRGKGTVQIGSSDRYAVCIPAPLAGGSNCENGPRFFQSSIDVRSTQPFEQFLGTLGQTSGYQDGEARGGEPWRDELRPEATKTIVIVSDDDSRLAPSDFENFSGGKNPFNQNSLPPGILDPSWNGIFDGYVFSGIYGWGSETNVSEICMYPGGGQAEKAGQNYTTLVQKTNGVRAKICDGASAWQPFFDAVAQSVEQTAKLACEFDIPKPAMGMLDPDLVNVTIKGMSSATIPRVDGPSECAGGGWYYDDATAPTRVLLCDDSCDEAQQQVASGEGSIAVSFGCASVIK